jgi:hypothetical protein
MDVYVCVLQWADHSSKESNRLYKNDFETEEEAGPNKELTE